MPPLSPNQHLTERSLSYHRTHHGKLATALKAPLETQDDLSLAYTPGVAAPCREIAKDPKTVYDYTPKGNMVAVVSDGSAVLGLGNIGAEAAIPVMEGKCVLFKKLANIDAFPICLATQDPKEIVETVKRIAPVFGGINLEDIAAPKCFAIEDELKKQLNIPVMHDDQHATAVVVLAGLLNALKVVGKQLSTCTIAMSGAGAAGIAIATMLRQEGAQRIIMCDSKGVIYRGRTNDMNGAKERVAVETKARTLQDAMAGVDVFIGVSKAGLVTKDMVKSMNDGSIVIALANPDPEILPTDAIAAGAAVACSGRSDFPNQVNNALVFPGIFRGALDARAPAITEKMKLAAAKALAGCVKKPTKDRILPGLLEEGVVEQIAEAVRKEVGKRETI